MIPADLAALKVEWRPVVGFEGLYEVSSTGYVCSLVFRNKQAVVRRVLLLKQRATGDGYLRLALRKETERHMARVHRLVLEAFRGPCPAGHEAAHLNGHRADNRLENLAWVTYQQNRDHMTLHGTVPRGERNGNAKLSTRQVLDIRRRRRAGESCLQLAKAFRIHVGHVAKIVTRGEWEHV